MSDWKKWAVVAAVPAAAYAVGIAALPRPAAIADERASAPPDAMRTTAPKPNNPTLVVLDDVVEVLGADLPTTPLSAGSRLPITFHFGTRGELDRDWQIFVHIDARRGSYRIHGDHFPAGGALQTTLWRRGQYVADAWEKQIPSDAPAGEYDVWIGLYIGEERMEVTGGDTARNDGQNRVRVGMVRIE
jgi:hypothetical protein